LTKTNIHYHYIILMILHKNIFNEENIMSLFLFIFSFVEQVNNFKSCVKSFGKEMCCVLDVRNSQIEKANY
jgi:hypothetical protein